MWKQTIPTTMQEFGDYCSKMREGEELTLRDERDGKNYTIAKQFDGKCWMTQDLAITGVRTLTSKDSDVINDYVLNSGVCANYSSYSIYYLQSTIVAGANIASGQEVSTSICPRGWKLPSSSEYRNFVIKYSCNTGNYQTCLANSPLKLHGKGMLTNTCGSWVAVNSLHSWFWTSTAYANNQLVELHTDHGDLGELDCETCNNSADTARCVAREQSS